MHVLITTVSCERKHELRSPIHYWIFLFMENKNTVALFLCHVANMSYVCAFVYIPVKYDLTVTVSQLEQPSCLMARVYTH